MNFSLKFELSKRFYLVWVGWLLNLLKVAKWFFLIRKLQSWPKVQLIWLLNWCFLNLFSMQFYHFSFHLKKKKKKIRIKKKIFSLSLLGVWKMENIMGNPGLWNVRDQIFGYLDHETLENCRKVSVLWNESLKTFERISLIKILNTFG